MIENYNDPFMVELHIAMFGGNVLAAYFDRAEMIRRKYGPRYGKMMAEELFEWRKALATIDYPFRAIQ